LSMMWADYRYLASSDFFRITKAIYDVEEKFHRIINCSYMRDSMHNTRRFEYPWVTISIPPVMGKVLDVGSGGTSITAYLAGRGSEYYALDHDANAINQIDTIRDYLDLPNIRPVMCDAKNMSVFPDNTFDTTISISVIEHMSKDDFKKAVDEIVRVTKSSGTILLTMDVSVTKDKDRTDLEDLKWLTDRFGIQIPEMINTTMVTTVQGSDIPFAVACIQLRGFK
jgi:ubiquinone/menaquinone biosynthesis C-methylase UbiE